MGRVPGVRLHLAAGFAGMSSEFDQYARDYDELLKDPLRDRFAASQAFFHYRKWLLIDRFRRRYFGPNAAVDWLDAGCGRGELLSLGEGRFRRTAGCDVSSEMLRASGGVEIRHQKNPEELPFGDGEFDFITAVCVYHHVKEDRRAKLTASAARVLRPGGVFCIIEHNPWNPVTRRIVSRTPVDRDAELLSVREAAGLMGPAGLAVHSRWHFLFLPEKLYGLVGSVEAALEWLPLGGQYAVFGRKS